MAPRVSKHIESHSVEVKGGGGRMGDQCYFTQFHLQGSLDPTARGGGEG